MKVMGQYCEPCKCNLPTKKVSYISIDEVLELCCRFFGVSKDFIIAKSRKRPNVLARQMTMYVCRIYTDMSLSEIGHFFLGRDHTTVIHSINTVNDLCDTDEAIRERFESLKLFVSK